jgi:hypothetical protein
MKRRQQVTKVAPPVISNELDLDSNRVLRLTKLFLRERAATPLQMTLCVKDVLEDIIVLDVPT